MKDEVRDAVRRATVDHLRRRVEILDRAAELLDEIADGDAACQMRTASVAVRDFIRLPEEHPANDLKINPFDLRIGLSRMAEQVRAELGEAESDGPACTCGVSYYWEYSGANAKVRCPVHGRSG